MIFEDLKEYTKWLCEWFFVCVSAMFLVGLTPISRDDTDPGNWGARSNIRPVTDSLTGCQYIETSKGGITPRVDGKGRHIGCK